MHVHCGDAEIRGFAIGKFVIGDFCNLRRTVLGRTVWVSLFSPMSSKTAIEAIAEVFELSITNYQLQILFPRPLRFHNRSDAATRPEVSPHCGPYGLGGADNIFQHPVDDVLLEDAEVTILEQIFLQRL